MNLEFFLASGYTLIRNAADSSSVTGLRREWERLGQEPGLGDRRSDDGIAYRRAQIYQRSELVRATAHSVARQLTDLLGPNVEYFLNRHNHFTASTAAAGPWHRDSGDISRSFLSVLLYLDDASLLNGCTWIVPASHRTPAPSGPLMGYDDPGLADQALPILATAGDAIAFDSRLIHAVGANASGAVRRACVMGFQSPDPFTVESSDHLILVSGTRPDEGKPFEHWSQR